jgi:hypothetical protein
MERYDWDRGLFRRPRGNRYGGDYADEFGGGWRERHPGGGRFRGGPGGSGGYERGFHGEPHPGYGGGWGQGQGQGRWEGGGDRDAFGGDWYGRDAYGRDFGGSGRSGRFGGGPGGWERDRGGWGGSANRPGGFDQGEWQRGGGERGGRGQRGFGGQGGPRGQGGFGGWSGGYDSAYAREPFMPEQAYLEHPEYDRPQRHMRDRWPSEAAGSQGGHELTDDEDLVQAVRQNLFQDNWVDAERIEVSVEDGIVTLKGEVSDFLEARYAWDDAWETAGVRGVVNHIQVRVDEAAGEPDTVVQGSTAKSKGKTGESS